MSNSSKPRCSWCLGDELYIEYHDQEWGEPEYEDRALFEMLNLEGAQAGLSWITVLKKRAHYRQVFDQFDPYKIAEYDEAKRESLLSDPGIIRNKLKVNAFIVNAQLYIAMQAQAERGTAPGFSDFLWSFVGGQPKINKWESLQQVPATTVESDAMSKALKKLGFKFVGSTICYAFMQACGMVNDHVRDCYKYPD
jgi:DNA-3-methyladenine glycosylase I